MKKLLVIEFSIDCDTKIFHLTLKNSTEISFGLFKTANRILYANNYFSKKKIAKNQKFVTFVISIVKDSSKTIQVLFYALQMLDRLTLGDFSNKGLCHLCSVANTNQSFSENKNRNKKQLFGLWKITAVIRFPLMRKYLL